MLPIKKPRARNSTAMDKGWFICYGWFTKLIGDRARREWIKWNTTACFTKQFRRNFPEHLLGNILLKCFVTCALWNVSSRENCIWARIMDIGYELHIYRVYNIWKCICKLNVNVEDLRESLSVRQQTVLHFGYNCLLEFTRMIKWYMIICIRRMYIPSFLDWKPYTF